MSGTSRFLGFVCILSVAASLTLSLPNRSYAADEDLYRENSDVSKMGHKLGRGIINVLTGWIEIPKNIAKQWRETDPFTGLVLGLIKGIGWGFGRTVVGAYEIVTFPFPIPRDYATIMNPEFILPSVWGESLPLFRDEYKAGQDAGTRYSEASGPTYGKENAVRAAESSVSSPNK